MYYRIGGPALLFAVPENSEDLKWLFLGIQTTGTEFFFLGAGSNLLVSDSGFSGLVIQTGKMNMKISTDNGILRTGASLKIHSLLKKAVQRGWTGFEFLTGIPGTLGGAVFMNAGNSLGECADRVHAVEYFSIRQKQKIRIEKEELKFSYRKNLFLPPDAVIWAIEWKVQQEEPDRIQATIDKILKTRKTTQPLDFPSCGSVFKNPSPQVRAWEVIDRLGLRGHRIGNAVFSEKHPNFILNLGNARAEDVHSLIHLAKSRASHELNIHLEEEVRYLPAQLRSKDKVNRTPLTNIPG